MGKKAEGHHAPEPLPLDDLRWQPIRAAHALRAQRTLDNELAMIELTEVLAQGRLRCMVRSYTGERTPLAATRWTKDDLKLWPGTDGLNVFHHHPKDRRVLIDFPGWLYIWQPDFDRIWPPVGSAPVDDDNASDTPPRVKPGPKPHKDWPTLIARWLIAVAVEDPKRLQNVDALVIDAQDFLDNQLGWAPKDNKDLRAKIVELLQDVRR